MIIAICSSDDNPPNDNGHKKTPRKWGQFYMIPNSFNASIS